MIEFLGWIGLLFLAPREWANRMKQDFDVSIREGRCVVCNSTAKNVRDPLCRTCEEWYVSLPAMTKYAAFFQLRV